MIPNEREGALYTFLCEKRRAASLQARPGGIRDSLRREASQAAGAAPTLRYGPAGDSAPRLRLKAFWYGRKVPFRPGHTARMPRFWVQCYRTLSNEIQNHWLIRSPPFPS